MDLSPPHSRPGTPPTDHNVTTEETPCQRLVRTTANFKRFTATRDGYKRIMETLEMDRSYNPDDTLYVKIQREHEEISALLENVVSDFGSIPRCTILGCPLHTSPANTPTRTPKASPPGTPRSHAKRHNDGFITPPDSKAARKVLLKTPGMAPVSLENRFNFPCNEIDAEFPALPATQPTLTTNTNNNAAVQHSQAGVTTSSSQNTHHIPTIPITNQGSYTWSNTLVTTTR
ncbi:hypothetical protein TNCT_76231 [Trichonephila clavata]|uniref:Uncharacterized protein n=1 Tax=Trichonephila clavata TaxID=2740835 RepID=A0A8X6FZM3_TRICU|nr:hypothetical protein TNCT_76231 [Trichonephila clavata]